MGTALPPLRHWLVIVSCVALCLLPAFILGAGGADLHCQALWVKLFASQLHQGELYPRWLQDMFAGDGSPVFFYYPPLTYYVTALFNFLLPAGPFGYYPMVASAALAAFIAAVTFYIWIKDETGNADSALLGCLLYVIAPANLTQNFYYLMLFSSLWAYAWVPLLLLFTKKVMQGRAYAVAGYALSLCLLVLSNLPMTFIFGSLSVAYAFLHLTKDRYGKQLLRFASAIALGFGLSAFYLAPSLLYIGFANLDFEWTRGKLVRTPYVQNAIGLHNKIYIFYGCSSVLLMSLYWRFGPARPSRLFFFIASLVSLFMMLPVSKPLWDNLPLGIIQTSERLFSVIALSLAFLAAIAFPKLRVAGIGLCVFYLCVLMVVAQNTRVTVAQFRQTDPARYQAYNLNIEQYATYLTTPDLMKRYGTPQGVAEMMKHREPIEVLNGDAVVNVMQWKPRDILLHYEAKKTSTLLVRQLDFPGWRAFADGNELNVTRNSETGQVQLEVPIGVADIHLRLTALLPERAGKFLSWISAAVMLLYILLSAERRQRISTAANNA